MQNQAAPQPTAAQDELLGLRAVDGVIHLTLDENASFEALREAVRDTFNATPDRFRGRDARLELGGRALDLFDLRRLSHVLKDEFGIHVAGLYCQQESLVRYAERELKVRVYPNRPEVIEPDVVEEPVVETAVETVEVEAEERAEAFDAGTRVLTIQHGLRSGQVIHYSGDVMVYGDVNPGAEVVADGNVLVMGALKGMVHAGSNGDDSAIVMAFDLRPTQLRIGRRIAFPTDSPNRAVESYSPQVAWVRGEDIVVEPYRGKLPQ